MHWDHALGILADIWVGSIAIDLVFKPCDTVGLKEFHLVALDCVVIVVRSDPLDLDILSDICHRRCCYDGRNLCAEDLSHWRVLREAVDVLDAVSELVECAWSQVYLGNYSIRVVHTLSCDLVEGCAGTCIPLKVVANNLGASALED